jgi:hypothetical protein
VPKPQACETAGYVLIRSEEEEEKTVVPKSALELWNGHVIKNLDNLIVFVKEC